MKQQIFALSLGFGALIFATHHAFAGSAPQSAVLVTSIGADARE